MIALLMSSAPAPGRADSTSAATPAVFGLAIDVPCMYTYPTAGYVERIAVPGANTSTVEAP
jgi:hypothetical protein